MDSAKLRTLLYQPESPALDFKQELKIYIEGKGRNRERDELRRDIISLANGNPRVAGENKYLIIGRADKPNPDGTYELFDIGEKYPTADDLLKLLAQSVYPSLNSISSELVELDGKRLLVITIPPTEYVHETTKELKTPKRTFTEHTVFIRRDESIVIASASDRAALRRAKQKFFDEREDVPPTKFGAGLGALLLAPITLEKAKKELGYGPAGQLYATILGGLIGALVGSMAGNGYKDYRHVAREWPDLSPEQRTIFVSVTVVIATVLKDLPKCSHLVLSSCFTESLTRPLHRLHFPPN
jgi:hypothetical protein